VIDKDKAQELVRRARQIAQLMNEICEVANDSDSRDLICQAYPFQGSLDEVAFDVLTWRDTMAEKAEVPLCP
jgi:hypothetical protein